MDKYIECFENYIKSFDLSNENLKRKKEHTYRVMKFCNFIAKDLGLNEQDIFLANVIGLFHDIGRFYQYEKYGKFHDWQTIDHGEISVEILKDKKMIDDIEEKELVFTAIQNHNKIKVEDNKSERERLFCDLIRDADKLDILNLVIEGRIKVNSYEEKYSEEAITTLLEGKSIDLSKFNRKVDQSLVKIGLINDLVFPVTKRYVIKHEIIDQVISIYKQKNQVEKETLEKVKVKIKERLGEEIC